MGVTGEHQRELGFLWGFRNVEGKTGGPPTYPSTSEEGRARVWEGGQGSSSQNGVAPTVLLGEKGSSSGPSCLPGTRKTRDPTSAGENPPSRQKPSWEQMELAKWKAGPGLGRNQRDQTPGDLNLGPWVPRPNSHAAACTLLAKRNPSPFPWNPLHSRA